MRDLALLDEERPVARHARDDRAQLVHPARVVEARDEDAAVNAADELLARPRPRLDLQMQRQRAVEGVRRDGVAGARLTRSESGLRVVHLRPRDPLLDLRSLPTRLPSV